MNQYNIDAYDFALPESLIARTPEKQREKSRLFCIDREKGQHQHKFFYDLPSFLREGDLLLLNNSKVRRARLYFQSEKGTLHEVLFLDLPDQEGHFRAIVSKRKKLRPDDILSMKGDKDGDKKIRYLKPEMDYALFESKFPISEEFFESNGTLPLPPYLNRAAEEMDLERYQTVFAEKIGSVAAPTASLHFTTDLIAQIKSRGVDIQYATLYVGAGTFSPVRSKDIRDHHMHWESFEMKIATLKKILRKKKEGARIIPVGTTSMRMLESIFQAGFTNPEMLDQLIQQGQGQKKIAENKNPDISNAVDHGSVHWKIQGELILAQTSIFIYPGFPFHMSDALISNFHTPKSTLLMLVSAFYNREKILSAYNEAQKLEYRFFSYGDAMFLF